jgi:hypothetical protein
MSTYLLQKCRPSEDAVTGMLVDLLRAWPDRETLSAILGEPRPSSEAASCPIPEFDELTIEAWPQWRSGEPDVLLSFRRAGATLGRAIVEIKIGAAKSGEDDPADAPPALSEVTKDQLAKYQQDAAERWPDAPVTVVYLTHHALPPAKELAGSLCKMKAAPAQGSAPLLVWRSWRDVEADLRALVGHRGDRAFTAYAGGLAEVLRSLGMFRFRGVWRPRPDAPGAEAPPGLLWWKPGIRARRAREAYRWQPEDAPPLPPCPSHLLQPRRYRWALHAPAAPGPIRSLYRRPS